LALSPGPPGSRPAAPPLARFGGAPFGPVRPARPPPVQLMERATGGASADRQRRPLPVPVDLPVGRWARARLAPEAERVNGAMRPRRA